MKHGDEHTKIFHQSLKQRRTSNCINVLHVDGSVVSDMTQIHQASNAFYSDLLCCAMPNRRKINMNMIHVDPVLNDSLRSQLNLFFFLMRSKVHYGALPIAKLLGLMVIIVSSTRLLGLSWGMMLFEQSNSSCVR